MNIVDVVSSYVKLNKKNDNYWGLCPFHQDTKPSLSVSGSKQIYKCFACGVSGNAISFVMKYKNVDYYNAINEIENDLGIKIDDPKLKKKYDPKKFEKFELNNLVSNWYQMFLKNNEFKNVVEYLKDRKLTDEIIEKFRIGYAPNKQKQIFDLATNQNNIRQLIDDKNVYSMTDLLEQGIITISNDGNVYDFFRNRITIPVCDINSNVVGFVGRAIEPNEKIRYLNTKTNDVFGVNNNLFNINNINKESKCCYLLEGIFDVITLDQLGFRNVFGTFGKNISVQQINLLKQNDIKAVCLAYDNDVAGKTAMLEIGKKYSKWFENNMYVVNYDNVKEKDFNELVVNNKIDDLQNTLKHKKHFSLFCLESYLDDLNKDNDFNYDEINYKNSLKLVKQYGNKKFFDNYLDLLNNKFNIKKEFIIDDLFDLFIKDNELKKHICLTKLEQQDQIKDKQQEQDFKMEM